MNRKRLKKIQAEVKQLERGLGNIRPAQLVRIAKALGREHVKGRREPTYSRKDAPGWPPLSIPDHGRSLGKGLARKILNHLGDDILRWEEELDQIENEE